MLAAQVSDEISVEANFSHFIDMRIAGNRNLDYAFSGIDHFKNGIAQGPIFFEIASSVNFSVSVAFTPMADAAGNVVELDNIVYWFGPIREPGPGNEGNGGIGSRYDFAPGDHHGFMGQPREGIIASYFYDATTTLRTILMPGPRGNKGTYEDNRFGMIVEIGTEFNKNRRVRGKRLIDSNVRAGTYHATLVLSVVAEP
jgi:hypothetical protein